LQTGAGSFYSTVFDAENIVFWVMYCSEEDAQMRIYEASWEGSYEFRCEIDEEASKELASTDPFSCNAVTQGLCKLTLAV